MKILYLHIGHGKTGSSFIQGLLAKSAQQLASLGYIYPLDPPSSDAAEGKISSGNGHMLINTLLHQQDAPPVLLSAATGSRSIILSSEFFSLILGSNSPFESTLELESQHPSPEVVLQRLMDWAVSFHFNRIRILLFIRNPISLFVSGYQQIVKRGGSIANIEDEAARFFAPRGVSSVISLLRSSPMIDLTIRNYSVVRKSLEKVVSEWMGIGGNELQAPDVQTINRSMTLGELELQRHLNVLLGHSGQYFSDPLCEQLPEIKAETIAMPKSLQNLIWRTNLKFIEEVNEFVGEEHRYQFDQQDNSPEIGDTFIFSTDQLKVIGTQFGSTILQLLQTEADLVTQHAEVATRLSDRVDDLATRLRDNEEALSVVRQKLKNHQHLIAFAEQNVDKRSVLLHVLKPMFKLERSIFKRFCRS